MRRVVYPSEDSVDERRRAPGARLTPRTPPTRAVKVEGRRDRSPSITPSPDTISDDRTRFGRRFRAPIDFRREPSR